MLYAKARQLDLLDGTVGFVAHGVRVEQLTAPRGAHDLHEVAGGTHGPLAVRLRAEHDAAMEGLYYGTDEPPAFNEVLERVHAQSALLAVS